MKLGKRFLIFLARNISQNMKLIQLSGIFLKSKKKIRKIYIFTEPSALSNSRVWLLYVFVRKPHLALHKEIFGILIDWFATYRTQYKIKTSELLLWQALWQIAEIERTSDLASWDSVLSNSVLTCSNLTTGSWETAKGRLHLIYLGKILD